MLTHDIGINAGIIWNLLSERDCMTIREIGEMTHLRDTLIVLALGWLSRENKIAFVNANEVLKISKRQVLSDIYY